ncbi:hypothetical protein CVT25_015911 [Psilocybe cyanescens]|uniref:Uncharacterized protein n=1 Tax=Psilocybe cyanescens TaxID=93625 RepID=A0A409XRF3_PSICY|nr:hypothetical protein CVT25_015911 [Psilocybe cyanescens]
MTPEPQGLINIEKIIASKKACFTAGHEGLQAYCAHAIRSYLFMVGKNGQKGMEASERAAEVQGFSAKWGARLIRQWVRRWLSLCTLPESKQGKHVKSFSLLEDPTIRAELCSFLRSNKWAMNPAKLAKFSEKKMIPTAAEQYLRHIVEEEMPHGLKKYLKLELFPQIQHRIKKGRWLILVLQDEITAQANDGMKKSWVMDGEQPLKKKDAGHGIHQLDVICVTVGWMEEASESMEYGKNYEGYWDGEHFVKQVT